MNSLTSIVADSHRWNHMDNWDGGWMWLWAAVMMIGVAALIVWLARAAIRPSQAPPAPEHRPGSSAHDILARRYAEGELSTEDYRERLSELDRTGSA